MHKQLAQKKQVCKTIPRVFALIWILLKLAASKQARIIKPGFNPCFSVMTLVTDFFSKITFTSYYNHRLNLSGIFPSVR